MATKIKNILIFVTIAVVLVLIYIFFVKQSPTQENLIALPSVEPLPDVNNTGIDTNIPNGAPLVAKDFLVLLLNVKNIKLNDAIFSDPAFENLHDSSILLVPDGNEGRVNPFAQFGTDKITIPPVNNIPNTDTTDFPALPPVTTQAD